MSKLLFPALTRLAMVLTPTDSGRAGATGTDQTAPVVEIVSFRLVAGTTDAAFLSVAKATEAPLRRQPGFLRRSLVATDDGSWTDLVEWADLTSAQSAAQAMMEDPAFQPFLALIDMGSITMTHPALRWRMD